MNYAKRGWPVFPVHSVLDGVCSCGQTCSGPGKHPRTATGLKEASTDTTVIEAWWNQWPDANIGMVTGPASGLVAVDVDSKGGGLEVWAELQDIHGQVHTLSTITGSGGNHYLFQANGHSLRNTASKLGKGIDTRGEGGYIILPPSLHVSGQRYEWENRVKPVPLTDWISQAWDQKPQAPEVSANLSNSPDWVSKALSMGAPERERNNTAHRLAGYFRSKGLPRDVVASLMEPFAERCQPPMEIRELYQCIDSAQRYAIHLPISLTEAQYRIDTAKLEIPPEFRGEVIVYTEPIGEDVTLKFKASNIRNERTGVHARIEASLNNLMLAWTNGNIERDEDRVRFNNSAYAKLSDQWQQQIDKRVTKQWLDEFCSCLWDIYVGQLVATECVGDPTVEAPFLLNPFVLAEAGTIIFAPPGQGKSWMGLGMAVSMDSGCSELWDVMEPTRTLFLNLERSAQSVSRRIAQVNSALGLEYNRPLLTINARGRTLEDIHEAVIRSIDGYGVESVIVDSISRAGSSGNLNENTFANRVMDLLNKTGKAWVTLAHSPRGDNTHVFGSQMFDAAADLIVQLSSDDTQPQKLGVALTTMKANDIAKPAPQMFSLEFDSFGLQNMRWARKGEFLALEVQAKVADHQEIIDFLKRGSATVNEIAENTGIPAKTVYRVVNKTGIIQRINGVRPFQFGITTNSQAS